MFGIQIIDKDEAYSEMILHSIDSRLYMIGMTIWAILLLCRLCILPQQKGYFQIEFSLITRLIDTYLWRGIRIIVNDYFVFIHMILSKWRLKYFIQIYRQMEPLKEYCDNKIDHIQRHYDLNTTSLQWSRKTKCEIGWVPK